MHTGKNWETGTKPWGFSTTQVGLGDSIGQVRVAARQSLNMAYICMAYTNSPHEPARHLQNTLRTPPVHLPLGTAGSQSAL